VSIKKLPHCFALPSYAHPGDAGLDLYAALEQHCTMEPGEFGRIPTGIAIELPEGYMALVQPRSGLAARHGITLLNTPGLIDSGYRGEVQVLLVNHGKQAFAFRRGDRIAQLVVLPVPRVEWVEIESLSPTPRQAGGFGSSG
jgi:dUTP pyrophosphatase